MCEVDVFEHPRFCDEFSHLVNRHVVKLATLCWRPTWNEKDFWNDLYLLLNCEIDFAVVNTRSLQSKEVSEVDVFEHPIFCDEFAHLGNRHVLEFSTLCWSQNWMKYTFETI